MAETDRGILLIDKPSGLSSHGVVDAVRRALAPGRRRRGTGRFRCGHAGTLDPLATGLLLVLCGPETRLSHFLLGHDKRYEFRLRLGVATDTLDADGVVTATGPADIDAADVSAVLGGFRGEIEQTPPVYSAIKRDGRPLYKLARRGEEVPEPSPRRVTVQALSVLAEAQRTDTETGTAVDVELDVHCSSGTYVRALARDIAAALGTVGHVRALRRTSVGPFGVADALSGGRIRDDEALRAALRPGAEALPDLPALILDADEAASLRRGAQPEADWLARLDAPARAIAVRGAELFRMVDDRGELVAVGRLEGDDDGTAPRPRTAAVFPPVGNVDEEE